MICISINALATHLGHGDNLGACNPVTFRGGSTETIAAAKTIAPDGTLKVFVAPNPSSTEFRLRVQTDKTEAVSIHIIDQSGKTMQQVEQFSKGQGISIGSAFKPGIYYARVKQGNSMTIVKLVKQ